MNKQQHAVLASFGRTGEVLKHMIARTDVSRVRVGQTLNRKAHMTLSELRESKVLTDHDFSFPYF